MSSWMLILLYRIYLLQMPGLWQNRFQLRDIWEGAIASDSVLDEVYQCTPLNIGRDKAMRITGEGVIISFKIGGCL